MESLNLKSPAKSMMSIGTRQTGYVLFNPTHTFNHPKDLDSDLPAFTIVTISSGEFVGLVGDNPP